MIIRGTPKRIDEYVLVDNKTNEILGLEGFFADYIDNVGVYYRKTKDLLEFMERSGLNV